MAGERKDPSTRMGLASLVAPARHDNGFRADCLLIDRVYHEQQGDPALRSRQASERSLGPCVHGDGAFRPIGEPSRQQPVRRF